MTRSTTLKLFAIVLVLGVLSAPCAPATPTTSAAPATVMRDATPFDNSAEMVTPPVQLGTATRVPLSEMRKRIVLDW